MKNKIYIRDWLSFKPYLKQTKTDAYYLSLCNKVKDILMWPGHFVLLMYVDKQNLNLLSCFLVSYFEDIISGTNIWNVFAKKHSELYGKPLPFYPTPEYAEEEINEQDISFLVWYFLNTIQDEKFISPYNEFITNIARDVMEIFDEEYEYAPGNETLKSWYLLDPDEEDFYPARIFIDNILFKSYLFYTDTLFRLEDNEIEFLEKDSDAPDRLNFLNEVRDSLLHRCCTRLLGMQGKEWAAELLGKSHPRYTDLLEMSPKVFGYFLYKGQDDKHIFLEHIASGKKFPLLRESFSYYQQLVKKDTVVLIGLVKWKGEWWFSGIFGQQGYDERLVRAEKTSDISLKSVNFLDHGEQAPEILEKQEQAFLRFNHNSPIVFLPTDQIESFLNDYTTFYNSLFQMEERESAMERLKESTFLGERKHEKPDFSGMAESGLVFFNPKSGCEIAVGINSAFPAKENRYFLEDESEDAIFSLFMSPEFSKELVLYCIDHYKDKLPFLKEGEGRKYLDDIDFLLRFWKQEDYFSKPSISYLDSNRRT
jgi:hypothetical protein